jgi:hypothetical protein
LLADFPNELFIIFLLEICIVQQIGFNAMHPDASTQNNRKCKVDSTSAALLDLIGDDIKRIILDITGADSISIFLWEYRITRFTSKCQADIIQESTQAITPSMRMKKTSTLPSPPPSTALPSQQPSKQPSNKQPSKLPSPQPSKQPSPSPITPPNTQPIVQDIMQLDVFLWLSFLGLHVDSRLKPYELSLIGSDSNAEGDEVCGLTFEPRDWDQNPVDGYTDEHRIFLKDEGARVGDSFSLGNNCCGKTTDDRDLYMMHAVWAKMPCIRSDFRRTTFVMDLTYGEEEIMQQDELKDKDWTRLRDALLERIKV